MINDQCISVNCLKPVVGYMFFFSLISLETLSAVLDNSFAFKQRFSPLEWILSRVSFSYTTSDIQDVPYGQHTDSIL